MECRLVWINVCHPRINQNKWTAQENQRLIELARVYREKNWSRIAIELNVCKLLQTLFLKTKIIRRSFYLFSNLIAIVLDQSISVFVHETIPRKNCRPILQEVKYLFDIQYFYIQLKIITRITFQEIGLSKKQPNWSNLPRSIASVTTFLTIIVWNLKTTFVIIFYDLNKQIYIILLKFVISTEHEIVTA